MHPRRGRAGAASPNSPAHRGRPARHNFNLIPLAQPGHQRLLLPPPPSRPPPPHKGARGRGGGAGGGHRHRCAGRGPRGRGGRETKGKLPLFAVRDRSGGSTVSGPAQRSSFPHPLLLLRLPSRGPSPQCSGTREAFGARVAAGGGGSSDNK